MMTHYKV